MVKYGMPLSYQRLKAALNSAIYYKVILLDAFNFTLAQSSKYCQIMVKIVILYLRN